MPRRRASDNVTPLFPDGPRPPPPADLSQKEAQVWRDTVDSMPARWFTPETWPVLRGYCAHVIAADAAWARYLPALEDPYAEPKSLLKLSQLFHQEASGVRRAATVLGISRMARQARHGIPKHQADAWTL